MCKMVLQSSNAPSSLLHQALSWDLLGQRMRSVILLLLVTLGPTLLLDIEVTKSGKMYVRLVGMWLPNASATSDYDSNNSKGDPFENDSAVFGVQLSPEARGPDPVVIQPVKAYCNHKTEAPQPTEPGKSSPLTNAKPDSRSQHSFDTVGSFDMESSVSSPKSVPRRKTRGTKRVSKVRLPLSPATSHSPPRVRPRSGKATVNISDASKTINLLSDNLNPAGATGVTRTRGMKRKRVIESEDESEPTAKKPKSETAAVERTTSPRPMGSTYETRWNATKANPRHKILLTLTGTEDPDAPPATANRRPEVASARANIVKEKAKRQPKACSPPQGSNAQSSASECERILEWDCGAFA